MFSAQPLGQLLEGLETAGLRDHGYCAGRRIEFLPLPCLAEGGEGWILDAATLRPGEVLKLFKPPAMAPFRELAEEKWDEYPKKIPELKNFKLPRAAVRPLEVVAETRGPGGRLLGYFMRRIDGCDLSELTTKESRVAAGYRKNDVMHIFSRIHSLTSELHREGIIIGDEKPQNFRLCGTQPFLVDLESVGFGAYECRGFTEHYVDPLLCDTGLDHPEKIRPYTELSDWYAFEAMLFECLCGISAYGGIYRAGPGEEEVPDGARALRGISVFNVRVGLPAFVEHANLLPQALRDRFFATFEKLHRGAFPAELLGQIWRLCDSCGSEHGGKYCPTCSPVVNEVRFQPAGERARTVPVERVRLPGPAAFLGTERGEPLIVHVAPAGGGLELYINNEPVRTVDQQAALAAAPRSDLVFLANDADSVSVYSRSHQGRARFVHVGASSGGPAASFARVRRAGDRPRSWRVRVKQGDHGPLFESAENYFGYIDPAGNLTLCTARHMPKGYTYPLQMRAAAQLAVGRNVLAVADGRTILVLQVDARVRALTGAKIPIAAGERLIALAAHPHSSLILATLAGEGERRRSTRIYRGDGQPLLSLCSSKETMWWFDDETSAGQPCLLYWQEEKLCRAVINAGAGLTRLWGITGIPRPCERERPYHIRNTVYFISNGEIFRIALF